MTVGEASHLSHSHHQAPKVFTDPHSILDMGVTEFGPMVAKDGVDPMDETTEAGKIVATVYQNIVKEKTGPYCLY